MGRAKKRFKWSTDVRAKGVRTYTKKYKPRSIEDSIVSFAPISPMEEVEFAKIKLEAKRLKQEAYRKLHPKKEKQLVAKAVIEKKKKKQIGTRELLIQSFKQALGQEREKK